MKVLFIIYLLYIIIPCYFCRQCLSCTGVESPESCDHIITCQQSEACHHAVGLIFGRQVEGHHLKCTHCCNNTDFCNQQLKCGTQANTSIELPRECSEINPRIKANGVYTIYPFGLREHPRAVFCKFVADNEIWTVFQRRYNGSVNFYRDWENYKDGFGSPYGEYWLGNDVIHAITSSANHELKVVMEDFEGHTKYVEYTTFSIGDEHGGYPLTVFNFRGTARNCLSQANGIKFSTFDRDNDHSTSDCAELFKGAWWYDNCHCSNLNGQYLAGHHDSYADGVNWGSDLYYSLKSTWMMLRKFGL